MHLSSAMNIQRQVLGQQRWRSQMAANQVMGPSCDVFINHRAIDTRRTIASLLYHHLLRLNLRPFLGDHHENMKQRDYKQFDHEKINGAIRDCKIGVAIFSPRYCESYFCLRELALLMESEKKVIPIFCDVKPSDLCVPDNAKCPSRELRQFNWALEEAKYTVGLTFDSSKGNWSDVVTRASDIVMESLMEIEEERRMLRRNTLNPFRYTTLGGGRINKK